MAPICQDKDCLAECSHFPGPLKEVSSSVPLVDPLHKPHLSPWLSLLAGAAFLFSLYVAHSFCDSPFTSVLGQLWKDRKAFPAFCLSDKDHPGQV